MTEQTAAMKGAVATQGNADKLESQGRELKLTFQKLKKKSEKLWKGIVADEELSEKLVKDINRVSERIKKVQKRIDQRVKAKKEYGKTIAETEGAYKKIVESSQTMLEVLQYEAGKDGDQQYVVGSH